MAPLKNNPFTFHCTQVSIFEARDKFALDLV
jgi:hypothetical protein